MEEVDTIGRVGDLTELLIDGFDSEQVWQELDLQNQPLYSHLSDLVEVLLEDADEVDLEVPSEGDEEDGEADSDGLSGSDEEDGEFDESGEEDGDSDGSMDSTEREAARMAKAMRRQLRGEEDEIEEESGEEDEESETEVAAKDTKKKKYNPLDDQFFQFDEMAQFADVGETGGGLLTNTGEDDEDDIYNLMYGAGDDEGDDGETGYEDALKKVQKNSKKRGRGSKGDEDDDADLDQALNQARKRFGLSDGAEEDDEDGGIFGDEDGSDVDAEDAYFEDFFAEPPPKRKKGKFERNGDMDDENGMDVDSYDRDSDEEADGEEEGANFEDDSDDDAMPGLKSADMEDEEDEELDEDELAGMSTHQREQRERQREMRRMEKAMLAEHDRDEATMMSTGDLGVSAFEQHQRHLQRKTAELEDELIRKRRWTMGGEVKASQRGTNSLLEEDLDFELATKQAPIMTAEVTKSLEETIKRRIVDRVFDDPVRKLDKPDRGDYRQRSAELDQEKSKKSLAEIYEDDYMRQTQGVKDEDKLTEAHKACITLFKSICTRMDALSNAHYTPLKVTEELDVVPLKDAGAIRMEEVTPITTSNATLLAPEEVYKTESKGVARGESEWTTEEKRAQRRERKKQHAKAEAERESEQRREAILHPERKKKTSVSDALKAIAKGPNTTISKNSDNTHYTSTTAFQKITDASAKEAAASSKRK